MTALMMMTIGANIASLFLTNRMTLTQPCLMKTALFPTNIVITAATLTMTENRPSNEPSIFLIVLLHLWLKWPVITKVPTDLVHYTALMTAPDSLQYRFCGEKLKNLNRIEYYSCIKIVKDRPDENDAIPPEIQYQNS